MKRKILYIVAFILITTTVLYASFGWREVPYKEPDEEKGYKYVDWLWTYMGDDGGYEIGFDLDSTPSEVHIKIRDYFEYLIYNESWYGEAAGSDNIYLEEGWYWCQIVVFYDTYTGTDCGDWSINMWK